MATKNKMVTHQKHLARLKRFRPIDDTFMRCLFKDDIALTQSVLRTILNKPDLIIEKVETQADLKRVTGARSLCLDAYASDADKKKYDIEVQKESSGADPHRARYHSSVLDIENLDASQDFTELPETYVIFITEKDVFGDGKGIHKIERMDVTTHKLFGDGEHIIYVNGKFRDDTELGRLMSDFNCSDPDKMYNKLLADKTRYLKRNPKGVETMCNIMEELANETRTEALTDTAQRMLLDGKLSYEDIAKYSNLDIKEVESLAKQIKKN